MLTFPLVLMKDILSMKLSQKHLLNWLPFPQNNHIAKEIKEFISSYYRSDIKMRSFLFLSASNAS
jgi:hypothetical protein